MRRGQACITKATTCYQTCCRSLPFDDNGPILSSRSPVARSPLHSRYARHCCSQAIMTPRDLPAKSRSPLPSSQPRLKSQADHYQISAQSHSVSITNALPRLLVSLRCCSIRGRCPSEPAETRGLYCAQHSVEEMLFDGAIATPSSRSGVAKSRPLSDDFDFSFAEAL